MLELTSDVAISVGAERRREVLSNSMRAAHGSGAGLRHAAGAALVAIGQRVAGDMAATAVVAPTGAISATRGVAAVPATGRARPSARRRMQPTGDCI
jgi:hypothetical protein